MITQEYLDIPSHLGGGAHVMPYLSGVRDRPVRRLGVVEVGPGVPIERIVVRHMSCISKLASDITSPRRSSEKIWKIFLGAGKFWKKCTRVLYRS